MKNENDVCISYPGNVEIFLRLHICMHQRHAHHHHDHARPHGGEESQEDAQSEAIPAGASDPGVSRTDAGTERAKPNLDECLSLS